MRSEKDTINEPDRAQRLILLHEADNVLVAVLPITAGDLLPIDGDLVTAPEAVPAGHKIARVDLEAGAKLFKYGAPIGSTTAAAGRGAHLHGHNVRSDYIRTHSREEHGA